jgi:hypothetical protein
MKRFFLVLLPVCFSFAQVAFAQDGAPVESDAPAPTVSRMGPAAERSARQAPVQARVPAAQRPQAIRQANEVRQQGPAMNPNAGMQRPIQPRIYNPGRGGEPRQPRVFTPNPAVTAPPMVQEPQPGPAVVTPPATGTVDPATRTWTGRGGNRGDWGNRRGIEGNEDWRTRRGDGNGNWRNNNDGTPDWRNNDNDGERRRNWRNGAGRRGEWHANRHHVRRHNWIRQHRSRDWWRSRYSRFALFGGGYYYWNSGYWYPAYGYNPLFSSYTYDAPIYSYNDQDPGEIIASVQQQLQRLGYYQGELDGTFGPMTRRALVDYQRNNGLPVTGEIDQDTLSSLGFE